MTIRYPTLPSLFGALALLSPIVATADDTLEQDTLEEIVVSDFRPTLSRDLPASIARLDAVTIEQSGAQHFQELTELVPNLNWAGGVSRPRYFQIRGIGERSQYEGAPNPSVGFVIDDLDFSALGGIATMFDVEQVEVLRGPQGTRYGANALAGLIFVKYKEPTEQFDARVTASAGSDDTRSVGVAVGGPLGDSFAYRAVIHQHNNSGFRDNDFLGRDDSNKRDELSTRIKLRYAPNDAWQVDLTTLFVDLDNGYDAFAIDNGFTTYSDRPGQDAQRTFAGVVKVRGDLSQRVSLLSISGVARSDVAFSFDADWGNNTFWAPVVYDYFSATERDRQTLSQEFRLVSAPGSGAFDWLLGASVAQLVESNLTRDDGNYEGFTSRSSIERDYEATSTAVFGNVTLPLGNAWSLDGGLRVERRDSRYVDSTGDRFEPHENNVGGQVAVVYAVGDNVNLYARIARGYKAGGFNLGLPAQAQNDVLLYDAEFLWNYELGAKGRWLDDRLGFEATAFWMQRRDQQVQTSTQLDPNNPATFVFYTDNAGKGRNLGIEFSSDYQASDALSVYANVGLLNTRIEHFDGSANGRDQAHAPGYSFALGGRYDFAGDWFARLDVSGKDAFYFSDSHDQKSRAYALLNARLGIERDSWSLVAWGRNLLDEKYAVRGFFFGNEPARDFADTLYTRQGDPRHVGLSFEYRYAP